METKKGPPLNLPPPPFPCRLLHHTGKGKQSEPLGRHQSRELQQVSHGAILVDEPERKATRAAVLSPEPPVLSPVAPSLTSRIGGIGTHRAGRG